MIFKTKLTRNFHALSTNCAHTIYMHPCNKSISTFKAWLQRNDRHNANYVSNAFPWKYFMIQTKSSRFNNHISNASETATRNCIKPCWPSPPTHITVVVSQWDKPAFKSNLFLTGTTPEIIMKGQQTRVDKCYTDTSILMLLWVLYPINLFTIPKLITSTNYKDRLLPFIKSSIIFFQ